MAAECFDGAPGPAVALAPKNFERRRRLGPAKRVRNIGNLVRNIPFFHITTHSYNKLNIFPYGFMIIPAGFYHDVLVKCAKGTGDQQKPVQAGPRHAADEKSAYILQRLYARHELFWQMHFYQPPILYFTGINDA